jgi:hypothetical protein
VTDKELDSVDNVSVVLVSIPVTISVAKELLVVLSEMTISDESVGLAVLVVKISVSLTNSASAKQE